MFEYEQHTSVISWLVSHFRLSPSSTGSRGAVEHCSQAAFRFSSRSVGIQCYFRVKNEIVLDSHHVQGKELPTFWVGTERDKTRKFHDNLHAPYLRYEPGRFGWWVIYGRPVPEIFFPNDSWLHPLGSFLEGSEGFVEPPGNIGRAFRSNSCITIEFSVSANPGGGFWQLKLSTINSGNVPAAPARPCFVRNCCLRPESLMHN